jgi:hypothetical protein
MLRIPHYLEIGSQIAVRLSALCTGRALYSPETLFLFFCTHFCQRLTKPQGLVRLEGLGKLEEEEEEEEEEEGKNHSRHRNGAAW